MSIWRGSQLTMEIFGESHGPEVGAILSGLPEDFCFRLPKDELNAFMARRAPGRSALSTARKESDAPQFTEGVREEEDAYILTGPVLRAVIRNENARSSDYEAIKTVPRPGHADMPAFVKYRQERITPGGGAFSGRMTAPLCAAGAFALHFLKEQGVEILSRIAAAGGIKDEGELTESTADKAFPTADEAAGLRMQEAIAAAKAEGDSLGGIVECCVKGLPVGLGGPLFEGLEGRLALMLFSVPAVKGVEFGEGFASAALKGSENNDAYTVDDGRILPKTNHAGGLLGGMTDGAPLRFRVAFKPTPSIAKEQDSVDLKTKEAVKLCITGRHDPCIAVRAVPVTEAAAALVLMDALLEEKR